MPEVKFAPVKPEEKMRCIVKWCGAYHSGKHVVAKNGRTKVLPSVRCARCTRAAFEAGNVTLHAMFDADD